MNLRLSLVFFLVVVAIFSTGCAKKFNEKQYDKRPVSEDHKKSKQEDFYTHTVEYGDTLYALFGINWKIVARINRVSPKSLRPGMKLLVPHDMNRAMDSHQPLPSYIDKDVELIVDLDEQVIGVYRNRELIVWYPISSGKTGHKTPTGYYRISTKIENYSSNTYPKPDGGAPMPYAMRFYGPYWIHGGELPGKPGSKGCIRLMSLDAKELYEKTRVGDSILIK